MQVGKKIFNSKISRQIFATFVTCALVPVGCLAVLTYLQVTRYLHDQTFENLRQAVKSHAKTLSDRLDFVEKELQLISSVIQNQNPIEPQRLEAGLRNRLSGRFDSIALFVNPNQPRQILNRLGLPSLKLTSEDIEHMTTGYSLLAELNVPQSKPSIIMLRLADTEKAAQGFFAGEINLNYLWAVDEVVNLPMDTEFCVLDSSQHPLYSSHPDFVKIPDTLKAGIQGSTAGHFEFNADGEQYFASYSQMFLKPSFKLPHWTVILFKAKSDVFAPMVKFKVFFPLFIMLTLMVVLWLSIANIRKNLVPIGALKKGAQRIAQRDFSQEVRVSSNDEFEELAHAFNEMSAAIEHKFKTLSAKAEIDRAVLSTLNRDEIIKAAITRIPDCVACQVYGISLIDSSPSSRGRALYGHGLQRQTILSQTVELKPHDRKMLGQNQDYLIVQTDEPRPNYLPEISNLRDQILLLLPIWVQKKLYGVLWLGVGNSKQFTTENITLARQLADQMAVALSNASLIEELKELNWGTLQALARTVDAKSHWTAGHSQRVAELALKIGSAMQLKPKALEDLQRAALLHDIGKVGIPSPVLDKASGLNDEEFKLIKSHPGLGAKIIEPIHAFRRITPIVAQHHERFDGQGYPAGLAGEAIHLAARILAVADVYDALSSDRPYRRGMAVEELIDLMHREAGRQFDPAVVKALLNVIAEDRQKAA